MTEGTDYNYHGKHTFNSYVYNYKTAKECLRRAQEDEKGSHYLHLACLTFCSFTMEAFLNHLGETEFGAWKSEDKITVDQKIDKLKPYGVKVDKGGAKYQRLKKIYNFRNKMAHGKTKSVTYSAFSVKKLSDLHVSAEKEFWGVDVNEKSSIEAVKDIENFVQDLYVQIGHKGNPFLSLGGGVGVRKYQDEKLQD